MVELEVKGLKELEQKLQDLGTKAAERAVKRSLKAGAEVIQKAVEEAAPTKDETGGNLPEGALKSDIEVRIKRDNNNKLEAWVQPGKFTGYVARWVEYGHRLVRGGRSRLNKKTGKTLGPGKQIGEVKQHPFIRPAFEASAQEAIDKITSTLKSEISRAARRKK